MKAPNGWTDDGKLLRKEFVLSGFTEAVKLIDAIAPLAESMDHHPDVHLTRYKRLEIILTTHDAGGKVTEKDYKLAEKIEALPKKAAA